MNYFFRRVLKSHTACCSFIALLITMPSGMVLGAEHTAEAGAQADEHRHFDARVDFNRGFRLRPRATNLQAITALTRQVPNLAVTYDDTTGAVRSLSNHTGYLTAAKRRQDVLAIALDYVKANLPSLGLQPEDLKDYEITDQVYSKVTGATHIYLRQRHQGLPVFNGQLHVNVNRDGRVISINNAFMPGLASAVTTARAATARPRVDLPTAVMSAAQHLGMPLDRSPRTLRSARSLQDVTSVDPSGISLAPIEGRLMWLPVRQGVVRLVWNFQIHTLDEDRIYNFTVDT